MGRGLNTVGVSSRWQQRAAAPPALPPREPASWMSSSPISLCSPWNSRPQTRNRIHEPVAGARAGASGSRRWPKGGSGGGSQLSEAGRGLRCPEEPAPRALPPPCLPVVHTPFGLPSGWAGVVGGACGQAPPALLLPLIRVRGQQDPHTKTRAPVFCPPPLPPCSHLRL